jgi:hypothetical protein
MLPAPRKTTISTNEKPVYVIFKKRAMILDGLENPLKIVRVAIINPTIIICSVKLFNSKLLCSI